MKKFFMLLFLTQNINASSDWIGFIGNTIFAAGKKIYCASTECCDYPYLDFNVHKLEYDIKQLIFGQHLVNDVVVNALRMHWSKDNPQKPLVLSFHGDTGTGKNYVAQVIANNTYKLGLKSKHVKLIVATKDFPDHRKTLEYQSELRNLLLDTVYRCPRSMFIFDEIDKLSPELLNTIKPFLDYNAQIAGVDFRRSVFLFLSNRGSTSIADLALEEYKKGYPRKNLTMEKLERVLMGDAFNEEGGLKNSYLMSHHLIDHYVPFIPLQKEHVKLCIHAYLRKQGREKMIKDGKFVQKVLNSLQFYPESQNAFSSSGCKRVDVKTDVELAKMKSEFNFKDEL